MYKSILASLCALALVHGQQIGTNTAEAHPTLSVSKCTKAGGCTTSDQSIVIDANWRWVHSNSGYTNCYTGNAWDATLCPDDATCAANCALDGASYSSTYGITTSGDALTLDFVTAGSSGAKNVGSRVYLLESNTEYQMFNLLNQEFTFDVDVSNLPCGLNGALYFSQMDQDGGMKRFPTNKAGAQYGTGYCDAQCPQDLKFINGVGNVEGWASDSNNPNAGAGAMGSCCSEMDIWEANSNAAAFTPHPCTVDEQTACTAGGNCTTTCDQAGCDFNSYRMGDTGFYGTGLTVDTKSKFSVVTQFITDDGTATGNLAQISRFYVQNGNVVPNSMTNIAGIDGTNAISEQFCKQQKTAFGDADTFDTMGGLQKMGQVFSQGQGMVLVMSIWDDYKANCLWLDSEYPVGGNPSTPGIGRGPCPANSGVPATVEAQYPRSSVTFSNIKWGDIDSTFSGTSGSGSGSTPSKPSTTTAAAAHASTPASGGATVAEYGQCGGAGWTGATVCVAGTTCQVQNSYYSQCL